mmetsp:Transcript_19469/g.40100  ORF Transcript_19469/g.40100 Transcript_19469/m.40100 type:complete len:87 (+) Transcript_19469:1278-1538(+)
MPRRSNPRRPLPLPRHHSGREGTRKNNATIQLYNIQLDHGRRFAIPMARHNHQYQNTNDAIPPHPTTTTTKSNNSNSNKDKNTHRV